MRKGEKTTKPAMLLVMLAALLLAMAAAGCSDDDDGGDTTSPPPPAATTTTETEDMTTETEPPAGTESESDGDMLATGEQVYAENCVACHGAEGEGGVGANLQTSANADDVETVAMQVRNGSGAMPPFQGTLTDEQIQAVSEYVAQELAPKG